MYDIIILDLSPDKQFRRDGKKSWRETLAAFKWMTIVKHFVALCCPSAGKFAYNQNTVISTLIMAIF